jgi:hypothetical protein
VLSRQSKYEDAEAIHRQTPKGYKNAPGAEHPATLAGMGSLASVLDRQGKCEKAEAMNRRTLELREKALGREHPDTLTGVYYFVYLLQGKQRYHESSVLYERASAGLSEHHWI